MKFVTTLSYTPITTALVVCAVLKVFKNKILFFKLKFKLKNPVVDIIVSCIDELRYVRSYFSYWIIYF